jgi:hypothetical protein
MKISYLLSTAIIFLSISCSKSNYKVLEKSGKKPVWINGLENNYIITYGSGNTSEEAKTECIKNIREQIINAIAITVRSKTDVQIEQKNGVTEEKFNYYITSQSANLPALQGISLSKVSASYWEKVLDKEKNVKFGYYVKYPFSNAELNTLIADYQAQQEELNKKIKQYVKAVDTLTSISSLKSTIAQLEFLENILIDDRKDKVALAKIALQNQVSDIRLVPIDNNLGSISFILKMGNRTLKTSENPVFKSECAKVNTILFQDTITKLSYNYDVCKYVNNPIITLRYDLGIKSVSFDVDINVNANKVQLKVQNDIVINKTAETEHQILNAKADISLNSMYGNPIRIYRIDLIPDNQQGWKVDSLNIYLNQKGVKTLNLNLNQNVNKFEYSSKNKAFPYLTMVIYYQNLGAKKSEMIKLNSQAYVTNW